MPKLNVHVESKKISEPTNPISSLLDHSGGAPGDPWRGVAWAAPPPPFHPLETPFVAHQPQQIEFSIGQRQ